MIDVLIPHGPNDDRCLAECVRRAIAHVVGVRRVHVVSHDAEKARRLIAENDIAGDIVAVHDEATPGLFPFDRRSVAALLPADAVGRAGWYLQQLVKLYAGRCVPEINTDGGGFLVLDADVMLLRDLTFAPEEFHVGSEHHLPYFAHAARLLPWLVRADARYSGVAHCMVMTAQRLEAILGEIEARSGGTAAWKAFLSAVDPAHAAASGASEYEIYFNHALLRPLETTRLRARMPWVESTSVEAAVARWGAEIPDLAYVAVHAYVRAQGEENAQ
ncbi:MAG: hypothetical protein B7Z66_15035 [Chromatiales bacterium 21-64-14]|nr:MAG: hypothetical protein B7Z66_15035 [Chromatiales bacterium 21-64-14]